MNIEAFAEIYLNLSLGYTYLSHCGLILSRMISQNTERVPVYLSREKCADYLYVERGTMIIDNTVLEDRKEYRLRSTIGHKCGHWIFHSDYYTHTNYQSQIKSLSGIVRCRKTDIECGLGTTGKRRMITDKDWLEHLAKFFGAAILMPNTPVVSVALDMQKNNYYSEIDMKLVMVVTKLTGNEENNGSRAQEYSRYAAHKWNGFDGVTGGDRD